MWKKFVILDRTIVEYRVAFLLATMPFPDASVCTTKDLVKFGSTSAGEHVMAIFNS